MSTMINRKTITKKEAKQILKLLNQWTRAEIMARFGHFESLEFAEYYRIKLDKADEIRRLVFGTDSLLKLGYKWKLIKRSGKIKHGSVKKNKKTSA